jgi:hypothetical protein
MNKKRNMGIAFLVTAGLLIIFTGGVYANALDHGRPPVDPTDDPAQTAPYASPMQGFGMMGGYSGDETTPPMMDAMIDAISEATGLSADEIEARLADGEHLYIIAADAGMTDEEFDALMDDVHDSYFDQVREQMGNSDRYEWMLNHMQEEWEERGFGAYGQDSDSPFPYENGTGRFSGGCW